MQILSPQQAHGYIHSAWFTAYTLKTYHISEHFTWAEVFHNRTLADMRSAGITIYQNALQQAQRMEKVRAYLSKKLKRDCPVTVISWWRSPMANSAVGGSNKSQHLLALATDFTVEGVKPSLVQALLIPEKDRIGFCLEITNGNWTHIDGRPKHIVFVNAGGGAYPVMTLPQMQEFIRKHAA